MEGETCVEQRNGDAAEGPVKAAVIASYRYSKVAMGFQYYHYHTY